MTKAPCLLLFVALMSLTVLVRGEESQPAIEPSEQSSGVDGQPNDGGEVVERGLSPGIIPRPPALNPQSMQPILPGPPPTKIVTQSSHTSITLTWPVVQGASGYLVTREGVAPTLGTAPNLTMATPTPITSTANCPQTLQGSSLPRDPKTGAPAFVQCASFIETGLMPGRTYQRKVIAVFPDNRRGVSELVTVSTLPAVNPTMSVNVTDPWIGGPIAPEELNGVRSVTVTWPPAPGATGYALGGPNIPGPRVSATTQNFRTSLTPGDYTFTLVTCYGPATSSPQPPPGVPGTTSPQAPTTISPPPPPSGQVPDCLGDGANASRVSISIPKPVRGFADLHNHQHSNLGYGGKGLWGAAFRRGNETIEQVLRRCFEIHGSEGKNDLLGHFFGVATNAKNLFNIGHKEGGYPDFDGWPRWNNITHQGVYEDWLYRAHQGGLQLIVMLAVNNEQSCEKFSLKAPGRTCDDMEAITYQIRAAKEMEAELDRRNGGPGKGWYRVVYTPSQAREAIAKGQLAVVLGAEVDNLFDCYSHTGSLCNEVTVAARIQDLHAMGLRYLFPIHFSDNQFGGTAFHIGLQYQQMDAVVDVPVVGQVTRPGFWYLIETTACGDRGYLLEGGRCNTRGLNELGRFLIRQMMSKGMLFDIDHSSRKAMDDMFALAREANYPVMSGHARFLDIALKNNRSEVQKTRRDLETIRNLGGMVAALASQGSLEDTATWSGAAAKRVFHTCSESAESWAQAYLYAVQTVPGMPLGIGTDFNGFAYPPGPRFGSSSCRTDYQGDRLVDPALQEKRREMLQKSVKYPFTALATGVQMDQSKVGSKVFNINSEGTAHVGMLPDFVAELQAIGLTNEDLAPFMKSAEGFLLSWERAEARKIPAPRPQLWSEKLRGSLDTSDRDIINYEIRRGAVDPKTVEFVLALASGIDWEKQMNVPDGQGSNWDIKVYGTGQTARQSISLWAHQTRNGQQLTFKKKKGLAQGLQILNVLKLGDLQGLKPGDSVTFTWIKD